jgi:hypothetical protein
LSENKARAAFSPRARPKTSSPSGGVASTPMLLFKLLSHPLQQKLFSMKHKRPSRGSVMFLLMLTLSVMSEVNRRLRFFSVSSGSGWTHLVLAGSSLCAGLWGMCAAESRGGATTQRVERVHSRHPEQSLSVERGCERGCCQCGCCQRSHRCSLEPLTESRTPWCVSAEIVFHSDEGIASCHETMFTSK